MPLEQISILDIVCPLIDGTKNGSIQWEAESSESDSFRTNLKAGGVRLSRTISFSAFTTTPAPIAGYVVELLDPKGRSIFQFQPQDTQEDLTAVNELFDLARHQALKLDPTITALVEEIRERSKRQ